MGLRIKPVDGMMNLSDLIIHHPEVTTFEQLLVIVAMAAKDGARFINYDVKPDFADTPRKWQDQIESVFALGPRYLGEPS